MGFANKRFLGIWMGGNAVKLLRETLRQTQSQRQQIQRQTDTGEFATISEVVGCFFETPGEL